MTKRNSIQLTGFTLIELIICIAITSVVSVLVVAQYRVPREEKLAVAAQRVMADLIYTQNRAIADHKTQIAQFDPVAESRRLAQPGQTTGPTVDEVSFDGQTAIAFDDLGMPYSYCSQTRRLVPLSAGSVVVKCGDDQMTVRILPLTGQIQVQ